jgi:ATP-dependent Clp protease ATP-binding subunit ClpA
MNNFTPRAQQVLALARKEADRFNHNYVGTEHLLLGLIKLGRDGGVNALQKQGIDLETLRIEVEKQIGTCPDRRISGNIPYTPRVKKVLALAGREAKALNDTYVGTEHILLGLLREGDGVAARVLRTLGAEIEPTRIEIFKEHNPNIADLKAALEALPVSPISEYASYGSYPSRGEPIASSLTRLETDIKNTRDELLKKFETVLSLLESLRTDMTQLRTDVPKGNS